jgi:hypothetical protein
MHVLCSSKPIYFEQKWHQDLSECSHKLVTKSWSMRLHRRMSWGVPQAHDLWVWANFGAVGLHKLVSGGIRISWAVGLHHIMNCGAPQAHELWVWANFGAVGLHKLVSGGTKTSRAVNSELRSMPSSAVSRIRLYILKTTELLLFCKTVQWRNCVLRCVRKSSE